MFSKIVEQCKKYDAAVYRLIDKEAAFGEALERQFMWDLKLIDSFSIAVNGDSKSPNLEILQSAWDMPYKPYKFEFSAPDSAGNMWNVDVNVSADLVFNVRPKLASEIQEWVCAKLKGKEYRTEYDMEFHRKG